MKYFLNEDILNAEELYLGLIANELAEANRLKRIELEQKMATKVEDMA